MAFYEEVNKMGEPIERRLAATTLVALRAAQAAPQEAIGAGYILLPRQAPISRDDALEALSQMPKPILCAGIAVDGALAIACWPNVAEKHTPNAAELERQERVAKANPEAKLLFQIDGEEPQVLAVPEAFRWLREYEILGVGIGWSWSTVEQKALGYGATAIVEFTRNVPLSDSDLLADTVEP